jgi:TPR repeat protein
VIKKPFHILTLVLFGLCWSNVTLAKKDIFDRFAGVYMAKDGPDQVQFVLSPKDDELHGSIVYAGRDHVLSATVDGLVLKAAFGTDDERINFRMPLSTKRHFQVTFEDDDYGAWTFSRVPLPGFAGEFSGSFGRITLFKSSRGQLSGEYIAANSDQPVTLQAELHGLEAELAGIDGGKLFYSLEEKRYFAQIDGHFGKANYKTPAMLEEERLVREARDNRAWRKALAKQTDAALDQYQTDWPKGLYVDEIPRVKDNLAWHEAMAGEQIDDFLAYINRFPKGTYAKVADDAVWSITQNENTNTAYDNYLAAFPVGRHVGEARSIKDDIAWHKAEDINRIKSYQVYASQYPNGKYINAADEASWFRARTVSTDGAFDLYLTAFPQGLYAAQVADAKLNAQLVREDEKAFKLAKRQNDMVGYKAYLKAFPQGRYASVAQAGVNREIAAREARIDDVAWRKALAANTEAAINQYAKDRPQGRHVDDVADALDRLRMNEINRQDDIAYAAAQRTNTMAGYKTYLLQFGEGQHQQQAHAAINQFQAAIDARVTTIHNVQTKLSELGYGDLPLTSYVSKKTKGAIHAFERDMKLGNKGKADAALLQQLNAALAHQSHLKKAKAESAEHMLAVGNDFLNGTGVVANQAKATVWFKKAAEEGEPQAMAKLGYSYITGAGIVKDEKLGLKWLRKSVRLGNSEGMYQLGLMYLKGIEVRKHGKKGVGWLVKSAQKGRTESLDFLGELYYKGNYGIDPDLKKAFDWYQKAADSDSAQGMYYLAQMYEQGKGIEADREKAIEWYSKAAVKNDVRAQQRLKKQGLGW